LERGKPWLIPNNYNPPPPLHKSFKGAAHLLWRTITLSQWRCCAATTGSLWWAPCDHATYKHKFTSCYSNRDQRERSKI